MKRIALVGLPNTGKSTFFNRLTGASSRVGNWPGITVDLLTADIILGAERIEVVDLPGIYDLHGFSDDEQVVRRFLENNPVDLVCVVLNSTQLDHQLGLAVQLRKLDLNTVVLLNMADEAQKLGIQIDTEKLSRGLGCPTLLVSARNGFGFGRAREQITTALRDTAPQPLATLQQRLSRDDLVAHAAERLVANTVTMPLVLERKTTERLDRLLLHPLLGLPLFFAAMYVVFQAVYTLGAPLQDAVAWGLDEFRTFALVPLQSYLPGPVYGLLVEGIFDGIGTVASFVPVIILFFFSMALIEDTGYLSRAAFLTDALMSRFGLDGRGFVMLLMGFGCNVPALMGTRVMRSRPLRLLTMLIIPFSLCSARLQVFVFLTTALFTPRQAPLVLFSLYIVSFVAALGSAFLVRGRLHSNEPFVLELPPYRLPTVRQVFLRGWHEVRHFLHRATKFIVVGVVLVWFLTHYPSATPPGGPDSFAGMLGHLMEPLLSPIGISAEMAVVLVFGFVAKEIVIGSLVAMTGLQGVALVQYLGQQMDWVHALSFMLFVLLYTPCLSTVATLRSESRSWAFTGFAVVWALGLAWLVSFGFYQGALFLGY
ncbi:MAG: ferrous iron transport protein B [Gammaproteobacteria bacterium]